MIAQELWGPACLVGNPIKPIPKKVKGLKGYPLTDWVDIYVYAWDESVAEPDAQASNLTRKPCDPTNHAISQGHVDC